MQSELLWIWLSEAFYKGNRKAKLIVDALGGSVMAVYSAEKFKLLKIWGIYEKDAAALENKDLDNAKSILRECEKKGIRVITPDSVEYPKRLWQIVNPPIVLYAKGEPLDIDREVSIAIVGTRKASQNGETSAKQIAYDLAAHGVTVVSGLAKGIDTVVAESVLSAGGKTVAVFGCGVDVIYPAENKNIAAKIEKTGTLLSEYPPGTRPFPKFFPARNRIISGLSLGTVVAEAPEKSGALITAKYALEQNRDVFAIPSGIFEKTAEGTNNLIKEGAIAVTSAGDILAEYARVYGDKIKLAPPIEPQERKVADLPPSKSPEELRKNTDILDNFTGDERAVMKALLEDEETVDGIVRKSGVSVSKVLASLTLLEIRGSVKRHPGNKFRIKH